MDWPSNRPTDWLTNRWTDVKTDGLTDWSTDERMERLTAWLTDRRTDGRKDWRLACLIDRMTDWLPQWLTDPMTDWLTQWPTQWLTDCMTGGRKGEHREWLTDWLTDSMTDSLMKIKACSTALYPIQRSWLQLLCCYIGHQSFLSNISFIKKKFPGNNQVFPRRTGAYFASTTQLHFWYPLKLHPTKTSQWDLLSRAFLWPLYIIR